MSDPPLPTGLVLDPLCREHDPGAGHPERPARFDAVVAGLQRAGLLQRCRVLPPREAGQEDLLLCHTPAYLEQVRQDVAAGRAELSTGDTALGPGSERAARRAVGGLLAAADALMAGEVGNAFAVVRPPGHHAGAGRGMGFCLYNNVAIAARHLQRRHGLERILIADWDVHHGNGTEAIFRRDPTVLFFSTHQSPLYPGTGAAAEHGEGPGEGFTLNCPLPAGSGGAEVLAAWREVLVPAAEAFAPQAVLVSAGFDSRQGDPLADFRLQDEDFAALTRLVLGIAGRHAAGRLLSALEGGYALEGLARAAAAHVGALVAGGEAPEPSPAPGR
ncbi:MAG: histone deacetylase [Synechococcaceae cyanobacterium]|nr:histone deacetylase [Synechococcaceae cyanobacterium]